MTAPAIPATISARQYLLLAFCVFAGPSAWAAHIVLNYALASRLCFPGREPHLLAGPVAGALSAMTGLDVLAVAISAASAVLAYRIRGAAGNSHRERTRFIAQCGLLAGVGFSLATFFDAVAVFMVPLCGS